MIGSSHCRLPIGGAPLKNHIVSIVEMEKDGWIRSQYNLNPIWLYFKVHLTHVISRI